MLQSLNMQQKQSKSDSHLLSVFNKCSTVWNRDELILWILCWAPDDELGTKIRTILVDEITEKKCGTHELQKVVTESISWIKNLKCRILCRFFRFGVCKFGDSCIYLHSDVGSKQNPQRNSVTDIKDRSENDFVKMIGRKKNDPICKYADKNDVTMHESDPTKTKMCTFFYRNKCHNGESCKFSHHPSFLWNEIIEIIHPWVYCDIPEEMFRDVFLVSKKLKNKFDVTIKVPRKETVENYRHTPCVGRKKKSDLTIKMHGNPENVKRCIRAMSKMLHINIFVLEGHTIVLDSDDDLDDCSDISLDPFNHFCDNIVWNTIGEEPNDPVRLMCDKMKITSRDMDIDHKNKHKIHLCAYFYNSKCKNGNTCTYSHHPRMLWSFSPGEWNNTWAIDECAFWALCYAPRNKVGNNFRRKLVEKLFDENGESHCVVDVVRAHVKWMNEKNNSKAQITVESGCQTDESPKKMDFKDLLFYKFMQLPVVADKTLWQVLLQTPPQVFMQALIDAQHRSVKEQSPNNPTMSDWLP